VVTHLHVLLQLGFCCVGRIQCCDGVGHVVVVFLLRILERFHQCRLSLGVQARHLLLVACLGSTGAVCCASGSSKIASLHCTIMWHTDNGQSSVHDNAFAETHRWTLAAVRSSVSAVIFPPRISFSAEASACREYRRHPHHEVRGIPVCSLDAAVDYEADVMLPHLRRLQEHEALLGQITQLQGFLLQLVFLGSAAVLHGTVDVMMQDAEAAQQATYPWVASTQ
jgi:hypothetical protein